MHIHTEKTSSNTHPTDAAIFTWQICQTYRIHGVSAYAAACAPWAHGRQGHYARMCRRQVSVWRQGFKSLQGYPTRIWHFNIWIEYLYGLVMVFGFRFGLNWCRVRGTTKYFIRVAGNWQRMKERKKENNNRKYKYN